MGSELPASDLRVDFDAEASDAREATFVEEADEISELITRVSDEKGKVPPAVYVRIKAILEKYQEQPQLLDPHLESMVSPVLALLREKATSTCGKEDIFVLQKVCRVINALCSVRGYKTVVKFFPHEAADLEPVLALLSRTHDADVEDFSKGFDADDHEGVWEIQSTLLLWLSMLVIIPFDLATVDTALTDGKGSMEVPPMVLKMVDMGKAYLRDPGLVRSMAAVMLSKLLTRKDTRKPLADFVEWSHEVLASDSAEPEAQFLLPGVARTICAIFQLGGRDTLLPHAAAAWADAEALASSRAAATSSLLRKLATKLVQRIGLVHLEPRVVAWRYDRGSRSLADNLAMGGVAAPAPAAVAAAEDEEFEVDEVVEEVVGKLLDSLRDKDTVVRWSAAKGIGRVTGRLPMDMADDVVGYVVDLFRPTESDSAWHGGCLALAELARRGLLLPARLDAVAPAVQQALLYDVRRGPHSVGAHVRDAASYVCWAFARAYAPEVMAGRVAELAPTLLIVSAYDREVNCRRAASAAFQENVGRLGTFPHGIDILTAADYFTLGNRAHAYTSVAPFIAQYPEYRRHLVDHLVDVKVGHWEKSLRELAARGLGALAAHDPEYVAGRVVKDLIPRTLSSVLEARHGAALGVAEALPALHAAGFELSEEGVAAVVGIVPAVEKARLYRGKGGEVMRAAVCRLIECTSRVGLPLDMKTKKALHASIDENLKHPNAEIQAAAVSALKAFSAAYIKVGAPQGIKVTTAAYAAGLRSDDNPAARRGYALALGALPRGLLLPMAGEVVGALAAATVPEDVADARDAETRVNACKGLIQVCEACAGGEPAAEGAGEGVVDGMDMSMAPLGVEVVGGAVARCLLGAMEDYCIDSRGDVGSWVREAAMDAMERCLYLVCRLDPAAASRPVEGGAGAEAGVGAGEAGLATLVVAALAKQAAEKIDRVRDAAGQALHRVLHAPAVPGGAIEERAALAALFPAPAPPGEAPSINWGIPLGTGRSSQNRNFTGISALFSNKIDFLAADTFPRLVKALRLPPYRAPVLAGLAVSVGGIGDSLVKTSTQALAQELAEDQAASGGGAAGAGRLLADVAGALAALLEARARDDRVVVPALRVLDLLFSRAGLGAEAGPAARGPLPSRLLALVKAETKMCKDIPKLCACVQVLCHLIGAEEPARSGALSSLLLLLCNRYPKVRKYSAEQLYARLLSSEGEELWPGVGEDTLDDVIDKLMGTRWDQPVESIRAARNELYAPFGLSPPKAVEGGKGGSGEAAKVVDDNESYASLVDLEGR